MLDLNSCFIYRIDGKWNNKHRQITGILYHYDYNSEYPPIIPHEQTNPIRVRALESLSLNNYPASFWITNSNNFPLDMLNQWFDQADNIIVIPTNDGMIHTISKLEKCYQSNLITKSLKKFLVS